MRITALALLLAIFFSSDSVALAVPGEAHAEARALLGGGDAKGAAAALDTALAASASDAEALVLRGVAREQLTDADGAYSDFAAAAAELRTKPLATTELLVVAVAGKERCNGLRASIAEARQTALTALEEGIAGARAKGDWETARQAAVAALRLDPLHAGASAFLVDYWKEPSLNGSWLSLFDPSLRNTERPEGVWTAVPGEEAYDVRPNGQNVSVAEMLLPAIMAPKDGYQLEATFNVIEQSEGTVPTLALGFGRGTGCTLVATLFAQSMMGVYKQASASMDPIGDPAGVAVPGAGRDFTIRVSVVGGKLEAAVDGTTALTRDELGAGLAGMPLLLNSQNLHFQVKNLRFRHRAPDGTPNKEGIKEAAKAVKKKSPTCLDDVDVLLADDPNNVELLTLRAEAAETTDQNAEALIAYRRLLDEVGDDKKLVKGIEKSIKKLAASTDVGAILEDYTKAVGKAERSAPRSFDAAKLRVLEECARILPLDKADQKTYEKLLADGKAGTPWIDLPCNDGPHCQAKKGTWKMVDGVLEGTGPGGDNFGVLEVPATVGSEFELRLDMRLLSRDRAVTLLRVGVGEPALLWTNAFPRTYVGLITAENLKDIMYSANGKKDTDTDNGWHTLVIKVQDGATSCGIDDEPMFRAPLPAGHEQLAGGAISIVVGPTPFQLKNLRYRDLW